jgi:hypothetical protein
MSVLFHHFPAQQDDINYTFRGFYFKLHIASGAAGISFFDDYTMERWKPVPEGWSLVDESGCEYEPITVNTGKSCYIWSFMDEVTLKYMGEDVLKLHERVTEVVKKSDKVFKLPSKGRFDFNK